MYKKKIMPFELALLDAVLEEFSDIPDNEDEIDVTFSPTFLAKSEKLIRNTQRKTWYYVNTTVKRIALVAIIAALLTSTAMAFPAVREAVVRFFTRDTGTHYEFTFQPEQSATTPESIQTVYAPTYLPDGYFKNSEIVTISAVSMHWLNASGNWISYDQLVIPKDAEGQNWFGVNSEGVTKKALCLNGHKVLCIYDEGTTYIWTDDAYFYNLYCDPTVSDAEMQKIFNSIQADENAIIEGAE